MPQSRKQKLSTLLVPLPVVIVVVQFALLGVLFTGQRDIKSQLNAQAMQIGMGSGPDYTHAVVSPADNAVYIPELRIKLPLNDQTLHFTYGVRSPDPSQTSSAIEADISTPFLEAYTPASPQAIGCSSAVRIKIEDKGNPYNPHEIVKPSVKLADGRTLQIYSFHHDDCKAAFTFAGADADLMAGAFEGASSY